MMFQQHIKVLFTCSSSYLRFFVPSVVQSVCYCCPVGLAFWSFGDHFFEEIDVVVDMPPKHNLTTTTTKARNILHEVIHKITNKIGLSRLFATVSPYSKVKLILVLRTIVQSCTFLSLQKLPFLC